jgi:hypothetical protein
MDDFGFLRPATTLQHALPRLTQRSAIEARRTERWRLALAQSSFPAHELAWQQQQPLPPASVSASASASAGAAPPLPSHTFLTALHSLPPPLQKRVSEWVVARGVPHALRGAVWGWALGVSEYRSHSLQRIANGEMSRAVGCKGEGGVWASYEQLVGEPSTHDKQIALDVARTFGHHPFLGRSVCVCVCGAPLPVHRCM